MDPDAVLRDIRVYTANLLATQSDVLKLATAEALVESVTNLDHWLSHGGFLPLEWQRGRNDV